MASPPPLSEVAMTTLLWEAAVMTLVIGLVNLGAGKEKINLKDYGVIILSGAIMETLALGYVIADRNVFAGTIAAAFVLLLWILGVSLTIGGTNLYLANHALWFTGILFAAFSIYTGIELHLVFLTTALGLLVPVTICGAIHGYTGNEACAKIAGITSFIDGFVFMTMAFAGAIGVALP
ncbi:MAG: hypothetical protein GSR79_04635 [Desulfurococcales archaeon]|nr:hypothetical protein [Desulfurococcales archaeon]